MAAIINVITTGTVPTVTLGLPDMLNSADIALPSPIVLTHPETLDLSTLYYADEIANDVELQTALTA